MHQWCATMDLECAKGCGASFKVVLYFVDHIHLYCNQHISTCLTMREKIMHQWCATMDLECAKLDLPEMTPHVPSFHPSSAAPATRVSWSVWDRRTHMLEMRLNPRGVSSP